MIRFAKAMLSCITILPLAATTLAAQAAEQNMQSKVVGQKQASPTQFDGSVFYTYFAGQTIGTKDTLTGVAVIEPGHEVHPPHKHVEEEFLMVIEGEGEWSLNGEVFAAKKGDILYAAPWDVHGVFNTGKTPLKFVVMKWNSKGVELPKEVTAKASESK